jgi:hypothetical protein
MDLPEFLPRATPIDGKSKRRKGKERKGKERKEWKDKLTFDTKRGLTRSDGHESVFDLYELAGRTESGEGEGILAVSHVIPPVSEERDSRSFLPA